MATTTNPDSTTLSLTFGAMRETLSKQLTKQGFKFDQDVINKYEACRHSMTLLYVHGFVNDSQMEKIKVKIFNQIKRHVAEKNNIKWK